MSGFLDRVTLSERASTVKRHEPPGLKRQRTASKNQDSFKTEFPIFRLPRLSFPLLESRSR